jgi:hypothetical protein
LPAFAVLAGVDGVALDAEFGAGAAEGGGALLDVAVVLVAADELAPAWPLAGGAPLMLVCRTDEKLFEGELEDAEGAGGAEVGPIIISRIVGVMNRAARA